MNIREKPLPAQRQSELRSRFMRYLDKISNEENLQIVTRDDVLTTIFQSSGKSIADVKTTSNELFHSNKPLINHRSKEWKNASIGNSVTWAQAPEKKDVPLGLILSSGRAGVFNINFDGAENLLRIKSVEAFTLTPFDQAENWNEDRNTIFKMCPSEKELYELEQSDIDSIEEQFMARFKGMNWFKRFNEDIAEMLNVSPEIIRSLMMNMMKPNTLNSTYMKVKVDYNHHIDGEKQKLEALHTDNTLSMSDKLHFNKKDTKLRVIASIIEDGADVGISTPVLKEGTILYQSKKSAYEEDRSAMLFETPQKQMYDRPGLNDKFEYKPNTPMVFTSFAPWHAFPKKTFSEGRRILILFELDFEDIIKSATNDHSTQDASQPLKNAYQKYFEKVKQLTSSNDGHGVQ